jgi:hypothetical protein
MPTSRQRFENWMLSGRKNSSPTFNRFSAGTRDHLSTSLTLYWQYLHPAESFGLSRYPPAEFTKSLAQAAHDWPDGGLNTANSSGLHVIFRPLRNNCQPNHETRGCGATYVSSVDKIAASIRVNGSIWYNQGLQNLLIVG